MSMYLLFSAARGRALFKLGAALALAGAAVLPARAGDDFAPLGTAQVVQRSYPAINTVLDANYRNPKDLNLLYGFVRSILNALPNSRVVVVSHGPELRAFAKDDYEDYQGEMQRMLELAEAGVEFRMCHEALRAAGFEAADMHGFVTVVPNGFAELALLQHEGHRLILPLAHDVLGLRDQEPATR